PYAELLAVSGYANRPKEFDDLLRILDAELRLVTPSEPEEVGGDWTVSRQSTATGGASAAHGETGGPPSSLPTAHYPLPTAYYQLTHDYLVPVLREWLTRKQQETWQGRAALRLEERTALWQPTRQTRFLPSLPEFAHFWFGVPRKQQKPEQRQLMRAA